MYVKVALGSDIPPVLAIDLCLFELSYRTILPAVRGPDLVNLGRTQTGPDVRVRVQQYGGTEPRWGSRFRALGEPEPRV